MMDSNDNSPFIAIQWGKTGRPANPSLDFCFSKGEAWLDLVVMAKPEPTVVINKGRRSPLEAGQLVAPVSMLSRRWNWKSDAVRRHVSGMVKAGLISTDGTQSDAVDVKNTATIITVINYETYKPALPFLRSISGFEGRSDGFDTAHEDAAAWLLSYIQAHAKLAMASPNWRRSLQPDTREAILLKTGGKCVYCSVILTTRKGQPNSYCADHVLPVAKGGTDDAGNLVPSCASCNAKKGAKTALQFMGGGDP